MNSNEFLDEPEQQNNKNTWASEGKSTEWKHRNFENKAIRILRNPLEIVRLFVRFVLSKYIKDDTSYLKIQYFFRFWKRLDLENPKTYNEKVNWTKLNIRKPIMSTMVDKVAVKSYVSEIIGEDHVFPLYGVYEHFDDIDFDKLPKQFVLKCNHDSHSYMIVKDKNQLDKAKAKKHFEKCLKYDFYHLQREWAYKNVPPRIIAEKLMTDGSGELLDYKFFCFNGKAHYIWYGTNYGGTYYDFYDLDWNPMHVKFGYPAPREPAPKPENLEEMIKLAEKLSVGFPHLRIDFYNINGKIYFGEYAFYAWGGAYPFEPTAFDKHLGDLMDLSEWMS